MILFLMYITCSYIYNSRRIGCLELHTLLKGRKNSKKLD